LANLEIFDGELADHQVRIRDSRSNVPIDLDEQSRKAFDRSGKEDRAETLRGLNRSRTRQAESAQQVLVIRDSRKLARRVASRAGDRVANRMKLIINRPPARSQARHRPSGGLTFI